MLCIQEEEPDFVDAPADLLNEKRADQVAAGLASSGDASKKKRKRKGTSTNQVCSSPGSGSEDGSETPAGLGKGEKILKREREREMDKHQGLCLCCGRDDVQLRDTLSRPAMFLAVGLAQQLRETFDALQWRSGRICRTCYRVITIALASARESFPDIRQLDALPKGGKSLSAVQYPTVIKHAHTNLVSGQKVIVNARNAKLYM